MKRKMSHWNVQGTFLTFPRVTLWNTSGTDRNMTAMAWINPTALSSMKNMQVHVTKLHDDHEFCHFIAFHITQKLFLTFPGSACFYQIWLWWRLACPKLMLTSPIHISIVYILCQQNYQMLPLVLFLTEDIILFQTPHNGAFGLHFWRI